MVTRRQILAAPAILRARSSAAADRPNIIWILGDDLGCELGCYGDRVVRTPNIDGLASEGTRFTQFHTTALPRQDDPGSDSFVSLSNACCSVRCKAPVGNG